MNETRAMENKCWRLMEKRTPTSVRNWTQSYGAARHHIGAGRSSYGSSRRAARASGADSLHSSSWVSWQEETIASIRVKEEREKKMNP